MQQYRNYSTSIFLEKYIYRANDHMKNSFVLLQDTMIATPTVQHSPRRPYFFCLKQYEPEVNIVSWFLNLSAVLQ